MRRKIVSTLIILSFIIASTYIQAVSSQTQFFLDLSTDPEEVEIVDPEALTGEGYYESGTCVIIDAKQTIISEAVRYEFVEWSTTDLWPFDPEDEPELVGNQAFIMMDGDRSVIAKYYEVPNTYTLTLETDPNILALDPDALQGAGVYDPGDTATISAEHYVYALDTVRYEFVSWTSDDVEDPVGNPADVVMNGDYSITAEYRLYYYLDAVTDPPEVQAADPDAVSGQGWYRSGTYGIVDAKQTVVSRPYRYEFTGWETEDQYRDEEGNPVTLPPNQAARFMDAPWTMVAQYARARNQGKAKGQKFPPAFLDGDRISVYVEGQTLPADEPYYVCHGWPRPSWKEYSGKERNSYLTDYWFELEIDGNPVELNKWRHKYKIIETSSGVYEDAMLIVFYVQFEEYEFEPGTYEFRGVWNGPGGILHELTVDVEFTE